MANKLRIKRRASGAAGAPSTSQCVNAELAYNEVDDTLYYGKGGDATASTSVVAIGGSGTFATKTYVDNAITNADLSSYAKLGASNTWTAGFTNTFNGTTNLVGAFQLGGTAVTAIAAELNLLAGAAAGTIVNNKAVVYSDEGRINATSMIVNEFFSAPGFGVASGYGGVYIHNHFDFTVRGDDDLGHATFRVLAATGDVTASGSGTFGGALTATALSITSSASSGVFVDEFGTLSGAGYSFGSFGNGLLLTMPLSVGGDGSPAGSLFYVSAGSGDVTAAGTVTAAGITCGDLSVVGGNVTATGTGTFGSLSAVDGAFTVTAGLGPSANLSVNGLAAFNSLQVNYGGQFYSLNSESLDIGFGNLTIDADGNLTTLGAGSFNELTAADVVVNSLSAADGLNIAVGAFTVDTGGNLTVNGSSTFSTVTAGVTTVGGQPSGDLCFAVTNDDATHQFEVYGSGLTKILAGIQSTTTSNGSLVVTGGVGISGNLNIGGNLTVSGDTTIMNVGTIQVEDKNLELGNVASPSNTTANEGGIILLGGTNNNKTWQWLSATSAWTSSEHINIASGKAYYINGTSVLNATTLGSGVTGSSLTSVGTIGTGTWQGTAVAVGYGGTGLSSAITGLLKGNGSAYSAATAGTDYVAPGTTTAGKIITQASTALGASLLITPQVAAPNTPTSGDLWNNAGTLQFRSGSTTKSIAFTDSTITGNAANVTGTVAIANGGTGQTTASAAFNALSPVTTLGDLIYGSGANANSRLAGNTTTSRKILAQTGTGSASAAPSWEDPCTVIADCTIDGGTF